MPNWRDAWGGISQYLQLVLFDIALSHSRHAESVNWLSEAQRDGPPSPTRRLADQEVEMHAYIAPPAVFVAVAISALILASPFGAVAGF